MKRRLALSVIAILLLSVGFLFIRTSSAVAASCDTTNECTNPIKVTIKGTFVQQSALNTTIANPTAAEIPSSVSVTLNDGLGQFGGSSPNIASATTGKPTISGNTATYTVTIPPTLLTTDQWDCDYTGNSGGCSQSIRVCAASFINTEAELADGAGCSKALNGNDDTGGVEPPPNTLSVTLSGTNVIGSAATSGAATASGCEGNPGTLAAGTNCPATTYPAGCYSAAPAGPGEEDVALASCPAGAVDSNGNNVPATPSAGECYVAGFSEGANNQSVATWQPVSCSNLTTIVPSSSSTSTSACTASNQTSSSCQSETVVCSATFTNPISWFVCPIVSSIQDFMNYVGSEIESYLTVPNAYFESGNPTSGGQQIYEAWNNIRNISLAILGIVALLMVFSQALSFGPFDAYTVKKLLPRILVAAVLVTLSWPLISLMVGLSNGIGEGLRSLIYAPFRELGTFQFNGGDEGISLVSGLGIGAAFGLVGTLSFALTACLALITGLVVIVIRQIVLILLAILAPIALVSYILPGTDKVWRLWWDSFFGVLIMFPMIEAFIAAGSVFAAISSHGNNPLDKIIGFIALYIPYFLLPATVRFAGGALRSIGGQVQGGHMSLQGGLSNFRKGQREKLRAAERVGDRWHGRDYIPGSTAVARRLGTISRGVHSGPRGGWGLGERGTQGDSQAITNDADEIMKSANFMQIKDHDDALMAGTYSTAVGARKGLEDRFIQAGMTAPDASDRANKAVRAWQASGLSFGRRGAMVAAARQMVNTGTGYNGLEDMTETLARAAGDNESVGTGLAGFANFYTKGSGRWDLAPGFTPLNELVVGRQREIAGQATGPSNAAYAAATVRTTRGADAVTLLRGKPQEVGNITSSLGSHLNNQWAIASNPTIVGAAHDAAMSEVLQTAAQIRQLDNSKSYASQENQMHVNNLLAATDGVRTTLGPLVTPGSPATANTPATPPGPYATQWQTFAPPPYNPNNPNLP